MKKYLLMLCCAAVCAGFAGCSDNDDDGVAASVESLVGRWSCYQEEYWEDGEFEVYDEYGEGEDLCIMEFNADGTGGHFDGRYMSELDDEGRWRRFTYKLKEGSQLITRFNGNVDEIRVVEISSSELVLAYQYVDDEGIEYTEKRYYHRIK